MSVNTRAGIIRAYEMSSKPNDYFKYQNDSYAHVSTEIPVCFDKLSRSLTHKEVILASVQRVLAVVTCDKDKFMRVTED